MLTIFNGLRSVTIASITLRLLLATLCGGVIGLERAYKRRPAGFRTHILICLGAAVTTLTSQFLVLNMHYYADIARLGAQVIAGIGFIGAGTIIVTQRQHVKGLTTAAGLWAAAIIGLTFGSGFYEGGICATVLVLIAELFFSRIESRILDDVPEINLYIEYHNKACLNHIIQLFRSLQLVIMNIEVTHSDEEAHRTCAIVSLRLNRNCSIDSLVQSVSKIEGVVSIEAL